MSTTLELMYVYVCRNFALSLGLAPILINDIMRVYVRVLAKFAMAVALLALPLKPKYAVL